MTNSTLTNNLVVTTGEGLYAVGTVTTNKTITRGNTLDNRAEGTTCVCKNNACFSTSSAPITAKS